MGELQAGIKRTRGQDPAKAGDIEFWLGQLAASDQILPMDASCFREWWRIMDRKPDELLEDAMIAATAHVHHLIVATRNEADFRQFDVRILNPFKNSYVGICGESPDNLRGLGNIISPSCGLVPRPIL
jgi:predicted nucleic acid-binding protein